MLGRIYIITNSINDKVYIGQTIQTLENRFKEHCRKGWSKAESNMHIKRAILKYGKENFKIKELEICNSALLNEREIYYIKLYDSYNKGYNNTLGGNQFNIELKLKENKNDIINLYNTGYSLRKIANKYNVDKATIKRILEVNVIKIRSTRTYKLSQNDRLQIIEDSKVLSRKEITIKWNISKSYLSQLLNGKRRI